MDRRIGTVAPPRLCTARQQAGTAPAPAGQAPWLVAPEIALERRVARDVALVVAEQVQLDLVRAGAGQVEVVQRVAVRRDRGRVGHTVRVLPAGRLGSEKAAERL